jgi:transcriptional regulator with PAS, ATPase and Fis domain
VPDILDSYYDSERILRQAAATFFDHLSEMCEGIMVVDRDARLVWINDRYERYLSPLGFSSPAEVLGRPVEEVVPNSLMRHVVETGRPILLDLIENNSGSYVVSRIPLHDDKGEVIGAVGLILYDQLEALKPLLERVSRLQRELAQAQRELAQQRRTRYTFSNYVGNSPALLEVKRRARRAAALNTTLLLLGETGTGKELVAQAIHAASARAQRPFIAVNVAAVPEALLEAEFFGAAPGAFTGADRRGRDGKLKLAHGGTLFLDEVGDMPLAMQAKLLRVLQEREFEPLGSNQVIRIDVRVIAATGMDLERAVAEGRFRSDLYYRLNVLPIRLPALRERLDDLEPLCEHLLEQIAAEHGLLPKEIDRDAIDLLARREWPGNVRELRNALEHACSMWDGMRLTVEAFGEGVPTLGPAIQPGAGDPPGEPWRSAGRPEVPAGADPLDPVSASLFPYPETNTATVSADTNTGKLATRIARIERAAIEEALRETGGNRSQAAKRLGIARATLYQKLAQHGFVSGSRTPAA